MITSYFKGHYPLEPKGRCNNWHIFVSEGFSGQEVGYSFVCTGLFKRFAKLAFIAIEPGVYVAPTAAAKSTKEVTAKTLMERDKFMKGARAVLG
jgi:hypothetical protein